MEQGNTTTPKSLLSKEELRAWEQLVLGKKGSTKGDEQVPLSDKDKAIVALVAMGTSKDLVAKTLDLDEDEVSSVITSEEGLTLLCKIQDGLGRTPAERLCKAANLAVAKQVALLNSDNDKLAAEASRYILDQAIGKALQRSEVRNYTLVADARSIHAKYEAVQEQLKALDLQRKSLVEAKENRIIDIL